MVTKRGRVLWTGLRAEPEKLRPQADQPAEAASAASDLWDEKPVPLRHPGQWVATVAVLFLVALLFKSFVVNPRYQWGIVGHYFGSSVVLAGLAHTIELTAIGMSIAVCLGVLFAVMRLSRNWLLRDVSIVYIWFFRGAPLLVQLIFWYNLAYLYPRVGLGVSFGSNFATANVNNVITPWMAAILGLSLNEGAYMAEIVRGGILAVDAGQIEAAQSLGMSSTLTLRKIVLPQAMRVIIPPTGNELIGMLKNTSLVSVMAIGELLYTVESIYFNNYETIPLLIVASLWYLLVVSVLSVGQYYVERHFGRGHRDSSAKGMSWYMIRNLTRWHAASSSEEGTRSGDHER